MAAAKVRSASGSVPALDRLGKALAFLRLRQNTPLACMPCLALTANAQQAPAAAANAPAHAHAHAALANARGDAAEGTEADEAHAVRAAAAAAAAGLGRPHLCLHCVFVGCLSPPLAHMERHAAETGHCLSLDVAQRQVYCALCRDHVYDADMERIIAAQRCLDAEARLPRDRGRVPYAPWQPVARRDADLLEKTAAAGGIVSTHYSFGATTDEAEGNASDSLHCL